MARSPITLTAGWMDRSQAEGLYWCQKNQCLGCRVGKTGTKAWVYQKAKGRRLTPGRWPALGVVDARLNAAEVAPKSRMTLSQARDAKIARLRMDKPLADLTTGQLGRLHESIGAAHGSHAANNLIRNLRMIYHHALKHDGRQDFLRGHAGRCAGTRHHGTRPALPDADRGPKPPEIRAAARIFGADWRAACVLVGWAETPEGEWLDIFEEGFTWDQIRPEMRTPRAAGPNSQRWNQELAAFALRRTLPMCR